MLRRLILFFSICFFMSAQANSNLTDMQNAGVLKWEQKEFAGKSKYSVQPYKGKPALKALSDGKASGLLLKKRIDLQKTPFMSWSWLTESKLSKLNERSKSGDDFVARVYVVIDGGMMVWRAKSVSYVWSSNQNRGQVWNNPYAGDKVKMLALRGNGDKLGQWYNEKRNVFQDLIKQFGDKGSPSANLKAYRFIDVVAIMTDTDNSKGKAEAYYGDILFSAK